MVKRGHVPLRKCAGCGRRAEKAELVRFTTGRLDGEKQVIMDADGTSGGRGLYLCPSLKCFDAAAGKRKSFQRLCGVAPDPELRIRFTRLSGGS